MATEEAKPIPPEPLHTNPIEADERAGGSRAFNQAWARWFTALRAKINVINESLANLGQFQGIGLVVKNGAEWLTRTITGTPDQVLVSNGSGVAGDPTISLAPAVLDALDAAESAVQEVVAGTNVTVDNTDPQRPIVSAAGSSSGGQSLPFTLQTGASYISLTVDNELPFFLADGSPSNIPVT